MRINSSLKSYIGYESRVMDTSNLLSENKDTDFIVSDIQKQFRKSDKKPFTYLLSESTFTRNECKKIYNDFLRLEGLHNSTKYAIRLSYVKKNGIYLLSVKLL